MPEYKILDVQGSNTEAASERLIKPVLSSAKVGWDGILVEYLHLPAHELPAQVPSEYIINLNLKRPTRVEVKWNGRLVSKRFTSGEITIIPPGLPTEAVCLEACEFLVLFLQRELVTHVAQELGYSEAIEIAPSLGVASPQIQYIALALKAELESGCLSGRLYGESLATALSSYLLQQHSTSGHRVQDFTCGLPKYKLYSTLEYINDNLNHDLTLVELANRVQMSTYHFVRMFKQSTGLTPHQYVMNCRIERAKMLLTERKLSIAEICKHVGFQSPSHFTAVFRKLTTITPKAYRNSL
ncbi:helix-turn-helix domain-containing protein [Tolypothrix campylonemoides VB511288]|nr:helix-turn-helix domain-containing protein [Tolypothrix campylonemoides VB511288]